MLAIEFVALLANVVHATIVSILQYLQLTDPLLRSQMDFDLKQYCKMMYFFETVFP